ncbi:cytochrome P450 [Actinomadura rayongensis]|uniref:Cytochrome P450 n=1 Tax=Actinomadura rayongensis TaxID=1429076 RepID=A0A6I4W6M4_9ACTN|nr:cytochrome P450 [Actinomadura rayongensis]MXQ65151.1 cytochrome P450 [Actinomadura rayongensis]
MALDGVDFGADPGADPHGLLAAARAAGRAVPVLFRGEPARLVARYADVAAGLAAPELTAPDARPDVGPYAAPHPLDPVLAATPHALVRSLADGLVAHLDGAADLVADFAARYPSLVVSRLLGLGGSALPELRSLAADPAGAARFARRLTGPIAERRGEPRDDLLSRLVATGAADEEIVDFVRLLLPVEAVCHGIGNLLHGVLTAPDGWARVRADAAYRAAAPGEALRWEPPAAVRPRRAAGPLTWGDVTVAAGDLVLLSPAGANRDPDVFPDPDRFDPDRPATSPGLAFPEGPHADLARAQLAAALDALAARFTSVELAVPPDEVVVSGTLVRGPEWLPVKLA